MTRILAVHVLACVLSGSALASEAFEWRLPRGFPQPAVPSDNPMSAAKVALGEQLFADTRLSISGEHSCRSCHSPQLAFTDGRTRSVGAGGDMLPLNAPTLINAAYNASLGWRDPAVRTLEQQMRGPLFNQHPRELGISGREAAIERELSGDVAMAAGFAAAFPEDRVPVRMDNVIRAIAAYERTLLAADSPFDRYVFGGDHAALDDAAKRGMALFFSRRSGCSGCHSGINFAGPWNDRDHRDAAPAFADTGTGAAMRVPTLRNLTQTAPYLHDGRFSTLDEVLDHYEKLAATADDPRLRRDPLTTSERVALREFLVSLAGD